MSKEPIDLPKEIDRQIQSGAKKRYVRFFLAALGSIPWVGGLIAAATALSAERDQGQMNDLQRGWLESHETRIRELMDDIATIQARLDKFGPAAEQRMNDEGYLALVRQGFMSWDKAATRQKRELVRTLLINAGASTMCSDDIVRLFLSWIDLYHEVHFAVIRAIYDTPGITRGGIWRQIRGTYPRDDSADADLFKLLIRDLSTGGVIRQETATTAAGELLNKQGPRRPASAIKKSAFDESEPYVLTALGEQFVHYCIADAAPQLAGDDDPAREAGEAYHG